MAGSGPQIVQAHFESLQLEIESLQRRILELKRENATLLQTNASLEERMRRCTVLVQNTSTGDQAISQESNVVEDDGMDSKPPRSPLFEDNKPAEPSFITTLAEEQLKKEKANTPVMPKPQIPAGTKPVHIDDTKILKSAQVDLHLDGTDSKPYADDSKPEIKQEMLDTQLVLTVQSSFTKHPPSPSSPSHTSNFLDVKPKLQLPPIPKGVRQPRQKSSRHKQLSNPPEDVSMLDVTEENKDDTVHKKKIMDSYQNPAAKKGKVKKDAITLSLDSVYDRIATVGHGVYDIKAPDSLRDRTITRRFLSDVYGGNIQATLSFPKKRFVEKHKIKCFMCLIQEYNPYAPVLPGAPGLAFGDGQYAEWPRNPERVFSRTGQAEWLYQGDYKLVRCDSLTPAEYRGLDKTTRDTWSDGAISSASWGMAIRARIMLRKELKRERLKRKPTTREVKAKMAFLKANQHLDTVTAEEVDKAYSSGKEVICVWAMKCVAYDVEFQRTLIERFNAWVPPEPKEKKKAKGKDAELSRGRGKASTKLPSKRRKPRSPSIVSLESDGSDVNIQNLGTKSRPAKRVRLGSEVF